FETVGLLASQEKQPTDGFRARIEAFLDSYPWFRRHPHPAMVHFPVSFLIGAPVLNTLALVANSPRTEWAAYCCLLIATASIPPSIASGYFTWWVNYEFRDSRIIAKKRLLAWLAIAVALVEVAARSFFLEDPIDIRSVSVWLYAGALWGLAAIASCIGFLGGKLVFPYESH
ncbi:MAG: hypothetical protein HY912_05755, partial [Desulfomonile tiedjei]|nr:hypothetical protein [Desulfomonile tiedjei]